MPHDAPDQAHWHEPKAGENAGLGKFKRPALPYDRFMEAEGVPVFRGGVESLMEKTGELQQGVDGGDTEG